MSAGAPARGQAPSLVGAGRYQAVLGDCEGCHTAPGGKPFAGGKVLETPFGKIAVPNITPDRDTGIGSWSEADFRRRHARGRRARRQAALSGDALSGLREDA